MGRILIIDDETSIRTLLARILELEGYEVFQAKDRASALTLLKKHSVHVILCDVFLPDGNGIRMVEELKEAAPESKIILLTAHGSISDGVQAIKNGAFDYLIKGDDNRKIIPLISRAIDQIKKENGKLPTRNEFSGFDTVMGKSQRIQEIVRMAKKAAATDICILLTGETGTGKEVFARSIHLASSRKDKPFIAINCSAFSKELLESELFGHKAGSFTGAMKDKKGLFEEANGGTIFLDEIGEMEYGLQAKMLRVLESKEFIKVGDTKYTNVDVRIIAATNRNLKKEIENKQFREDLYFRLSVFQIQLPPLRERKEDISDLADFFMNSLAGKMGQPIVKFTPECMKIMESYSWPGNIRELRNVVERALIVCGSEVTPEDLPVDLRRDTAEAHPDTEFDLASVEKTHIAKILEYTKGNKTEAAHLLKIGLTTLYRKIDEYGI